ncbi:hypothetical protein B0F90DRAFT_881695 [Multifurca ochricompacta]|uniref:Uncharacterized protein n=1 Tax=Multifurca ochricompacta TaxID=376703 RepID=A0AAD4M282_9AGAM|nr:hypothetical protein B0F90DRAFT_881695 [Multifurca ochricompacta]
MTRQKFAFRLLIAFMSMLQRCALFFFLFFFIPFASITFYLFFFLSLFSILSAWAQGIVGTLQFFFPVLCKEAGTFLCLLYVSRFFGQFPFPRLLMPTFFLKLHPVTLRLHLSSLLLFPPRMYFYQCFLPLSPLRHPISSPPPPNVLCLFLSVCLFVSIHVYSLFYLAVVVLYMGLITTTTTLASIVIYMICYVIM